MKISIRWALIFGLLIIIWGTQAITATSSYVTSQRVLLSHAQDIMENISEFAMEQSKHHLALAQGAAHLTKRLISANVVSNDTQKFKDLERYFFDQMAIYPHFAGIYYGCPMEISSISDTARFTAPTAFGQKSSSTRMASVRST